MSPCLGHLHGFLKRDWPFFNGGISTLTRTKTGHLSLLLDWIIELFIHFIFVISLQFLLDVKLKGVSAINDILFIIINNIPKLGIIIPSLGILTSIDSAGRGVPASHQHACLADRDASNV